MGSIILHSRRKFSVALVNPERVTNRQISLIALGPSVERADEQMVLGIISWALKIGIKTAKKVKKLTLLSKSANFWFAFDLRMKTRARVDRLWLRFHRRVLCALWLKFLVKVLRFLQLTKTGHVALGNKRISKIRFFCHSRNKVPIGDAIFEKGSKIARD